MSLLGTTSLTPPQSRQAPSVTSTGPAATIRLRGPTIAQMRAVLGPDVTDVQLAAMVGNARHESGRYW